MDNKIASIQNRVNRVYSRNARFYNLMDYCMERRVSRKIRPALFADLESGARILEVGVGTGKNFPFYPPSFHITAIEPSPGMRAIALRKAAGQGFGARVSIEDADVQNLSYADATFDVAVASFVFCSVADPMRGLQEILRVLRPGGELRLLEHQRPSNRLLAAIFDFLNPMFVRITGANINRDTTGNVRMAGFHDVTYQPQDRFEIIRLITARAPK